MFEVYKNKKVLITGITGFKGSWLGFWLHNKGAVVTGYALEPETTPSLFNLLNLKDKINYVEADILDYSQFQKVIQDVKPDIIFHLAAVSTVRKAYELPLLTYKTNVIGTLNLLEASRNVKSVKAIVNITTDKCYENTEKNISFLESHKLGGNDIYSSSKACSEILTNAYRNSFKDCEFNIATARAGNCLGGGDWTKDRIISDCVISINNNKTLILRNPNATRPWQYVLDALSGYLRLGEKLLENKIYSQAYNFAPLNYKEITVNELIEIFSKFYGKCQIKVVPDKEKAESFYLKIDATKSKQMLDWEETFTIDETLMACANWYKKYYNNENIEDFSLKQIIEYEEKVTWNKKN